MTLVIRPFESRDRAAVIELWQRCGLLRSWNDPGKDIARKLRVQPELFLIGELGQRLIASAMAGYDGHRGSVYYFAVDPEHQRRGFGRALLAEVERRLIELGCPKINLLVRSENAAVLGFYAALGYTEHAALSLGKRLEYDE